MATRKLSFTHVAPIKNSDRFYAFTVDTCPQCNCEVEGPNTVSVHFPQSDHALAIKEFGLELRKTLPQEMAYCDASNDARCIDCIEKNRAKLGAIVQQVWG